MSTLVNIKALRRTLFVPAGSAALAFSAATQAAARAQSALQPMAEIP